jgi:large subunit ribosomal protein L22
MADIKVNATIKGVSMAPRKVAIVAGLVRGRSVSDALVILSHTPRRAALPVIKAINSAKANATTNHRVDEKSLIIESLQVTAGPRLKRFRPAAMGRALPYQKKTSHIAVVVAGTEKPKKVTPKSSEPAKKPVAAKIEEEKK